MMRKQSLFCRQPHLLFGADRFHKRSSRVRWLKHSVSNSKSAKFDTLYSYCHWDLLEVSPEGLRGMTKPGGYAVGEILVSVSNPPGSSFDVWLVTTPLFLCTCSYRAFFDGPEAKCGGVRIAVVDYRADDIQKFSPCLEEAFGLASSLFRQLYRVADANFLHLRGQLMRLPWIVRFIKSGSDALVLVHQCFSKLAQGNVRTS